MYREIILSLFLIIQGCALITEPDQNVGYENLDKLASVAGCYQNLGERSPDTTDRYLSQIFWPSDETKHLQIKYIEVSLATERSVVARTLNAGKVIVESEFVDGEDFKFISGKIIIKNDLFGSLAYPSGNPFIGAGHTSLTLGIDKSGNGKITETSTFAGTAFIFIPVAGHVSDAVRFVRIGQSCIKS